MTGNPVILSEVEGYDCMERNIKLLAVFNFFTDFKFYSAILIIYFARVTGSYGLAMSLFAIAMFSSAVFEVPTGIFSDMIGRKKTILLGALSSVLYTICYAIGGTFWVLCIGAIVEGLSRAWYSGNNDALLHDSLREVGKKDLYAHYLGKTHAMFQGALMIGAVIGSIFYALFAPLLGFIADIYGPAKALIMVQFCMLSVLYINFKLKKMQKANP